MGATGTATGPETAQLQAAWLGRVPYDDALALQRSLLERRQRREVPDTLLLLEHPHVFTLGRRGQDADVLISAREAAALGASIVHTDRGGQATYHGPGQLVAYPILDLKALGIGPVQYVRLLERVIIEVLETRGVEGHVVAGETGVWTHGPIPVARSRRADSGRGGKIAAIGVRISRGITMHGFALNAAPDLSFFGHIVPCGMPGLQVASVASVTGQYVSPGELAGRAARALARALGRDLSFVAPTVLAA